MRDCYPSERHMRSDAAVLLSNYEKGLMRAEIRENEKGMMAEIRQTVADAIASVPAKRIKPAENKKEDANMSDMSSESKKLAEKKSAATETTSMVKRAVIRGTKVASAQEAENVLLLLTKQILGPRYAMAEAVLGEKGIQLLIHVAIHYIASVYPGIIPQADMVAVACELASEGNVKDTLAPVLKQIEPFLVDLARIGEKATQTPME